MTPGNGVRLQRIGALHLLEMLIPPSRIQVYTPRQQRHMDLCAEQSRKTLQLRAGPVPDHLHRLLCHRSSMHHPLYPHCFAALTARHNVMPIGIPRHHRPQILCIYYYLPRSIMLNPTITSLFLPTTTSSSVPLDHGRVEMLGASSSSRGHLPSEVSLQTINLRQLPSSPDPFTVPPVTVDVNHEESSTLEDVSTAIGGRYSMRTRQPRQLKPHAFDRLEYKHQLKHGQL